MTGLEATAAPGTCPAAAAAPLGSVSAVMVADEAAPDPVALAAWGEELARLFTDVELVIVANGVSGPVALALAELAANLPDITVHFLAERIDRDTALLVGLDTAVGDWVLLTEPRPERHPVLRDLTKRAREGYQVVVALGEEAGGHGAVYIALVSIYFRLYRALTGRTVLSPPPALRLYSRAAALYLAGSAEGEMLLKTGTVAGGFPVFVSHWPSLAPDRPRARSSRETVAKALRELLSASSAPLRLASMVALTSGVLSLFYSLYVVAVYLFKPQVEAGWTTLSLQVSGMMFLFSLLFALQAEYVLGIYRGLAPRRRYVITRELRSRRRRHAARLNVLNEEGEFRLGKPDAGRLEEPAG